MSDTKDPKWIEIINIVFLGLDYAVLIATVAFVAHKAGWQVLPIVFLPLFCAYSVGRRLATDKWMKKADAILERFKEQEKKR